MKKGDFIGLQSGLSIYSRCGLSTGLYGGLEREYATSSSDTTPDGKQAILVIGDSKAAGVSTSAGPTPEPGTAFQWNDSLGQIQAIGSTDVLGAFQGVGGTSPGSQWPQYAIRYNEITGNKAVIIPCGVSGSGFNPIGNSDNWSTSGLLYDRAVRRARRCLSAMGIPKLRRIIVILGVNDQDTDRAAVLSDVESLFQRLRKDFPGTTILVSMPGARGLGPNVPPIPFIRYKLKQLAYAYPEIKIAASELGYAAAGLMSTDALHFNYAGCQFMGNQLAEYERGKISDKWAFSIINAFTTTISDAHKSLIESFVKKEVANGNFFKYNMLLNFKAENLQDVFVDWAQTIIPISSTLDFTANDGCSSDGVSKVMDTGFRGSESGTTFLLEDAICDVSYTNKTTASGVVASLLGSVTGTAVLQIAQNGTPAVMHRINDVTVSPTTSPDTSLPSAAEYASRRIGTAKSLLKDGVQVQSSTVATTAVSTNNLYVGCLRSGAGTSSQFIAAKFKRLLLTQYTDFDYDAFRTNFNELQNNW